MNTLINILCVVLPLALSVAADTNTTVSDDDPSIVYSAGAGSAPICQVSANGTLAPGQPGCFNVSPAGCASHIHAIFGIGGSAELKFKGSSITVNTLLGSSSALYNVTLDGVTQSVDGSKGHENDALVCAPLFSKSGLDESKEHDIRIVITSKGPLEGVDASPTRAPLLIQNFIVTSSGSDDSGSGGGNSGSSSGGGNSSSSNGGGNNGTSSGGSDDSGHSNSTSGSSTSSPSGTSGANAPSQSAAAAGIKIAVGSGIFGVVAQALLSLL